jgi:DNA-binding LacI/PurR family transcriptional regulator
MHENTKRALSEIETRIYNGIFPENSFLPSERKLCDELGIGRGALLAIFKELSAKGQIRLEYGRGARVLPRSEKPKLRRILLLEDSNFSFYSSSEHLKLMEGIISAANEAGVESSLLFFDPASSTERLIERFSLGEFQAVVIIEYANLVDIKRLLRYGVPVLIANLESAHEFPSIQLDFREVGRIAGYELLANGHQSIGMISGPKEKYIFREMLAGLKGALAEEDIYIKQENIVCLNSTPDADNSLHKLLLQPNRPTAFFVARDWRAASLYEACNKLDIKIPDDISIVSYDNLSWSLAADTGLTTISEPTAEIGRSTILMLQEWLTSHKRPDNIKVHGQLIRRTSVKYLPRK